MGIGMFDKEWFLLNALVVAIMQTAEWCTLGKTIMYVGAVRKNFMGMRQQVGFV